MLYFLLWLSLGPEAPYPFIVFASQLYAWCSPMCLHPPYFSPLLPHCSLQNKEVEEWFPIILSILRKIFLRQHCWAASSLTETRPPSSSTETRHPSAPIMGAVPSAMRVACTPLLPPPLCLDTIAHLLLRHVVFPFVTVTGP